MPERSSQKREVQSFLYRAILENIISGVFAPGQRLVEEELARTYRISRTPIREVLLALEKDGLVQRARNRGARVVSFTAEDVEELLDIRKALEVHCVPKVVRTVKLSEWLDLEHRLDSLDGGSGPKWRQEHTEIDLRLHHLIVSNAGNRRLAALMGNLSLLIESLQVAGFRDDSLVEETGRQHLEIVRALAAHETETAQRLLTDHIEFGKRNALRLFIALKNNGRVETAAVV